MARPGVNLTLGTTGVWIVLGLASWIVVAAVVVAVVVLVRALT